jgi:diadenylate cyclase
MKEVIQFYGVEFRWLNVLDLLIVVFLIIQLYRLLKGSLAFNIFVGLLMVYAAYFLVRALQMPILTIILQNFINVGIIAIIIIFQPEIRKFLLVLGKKTPLSKDSFIFFCFIFVFLFFLIGFLFVVRACTHYTHAAEQGQLSDQIVPA